MSKLNKYKENCVVHGKPADIFCYECVAFKCSYCIDPHINKCLLPWVIDGYVNELISPSNEGKELVADLKQKISKSYKEVIEKINKDFENALCYLD